MMVVGFIWWKREPKYIIQILYWLNTSTDNGYCPSVFQNDNNDIDMA
jgi:hypothetical protein